MTRQDIGGDDGEGDLVEEARKPVLAFIELVIADGHRVELHQVQEFRLRGALIGGEEERTLEIVAGVEQKQVLARPFLSLLVDQGLEARDAAEALVLALFLDGAGRIELVDRFDARMKVIDVQDVQFIIGKGCARRERKKGNSCKADPHVSDHGVLLCAAGRVPDRMRGGMRVENRTDFSSSRSSGCFHQSRATSSRKRMPRCRTFG